MNGENEKKCCCKPVNYKALIKMSKFFKVSFWVTLIYVAVFVIGHWTFFIFKGFPKGAGIDIQTGILSSVSYIVLGSIAACLFYSLSEIIKLLVNRECCKIGL